jgi:hypothetical protein
LEITVKKKEPGGSVWRMCKVKRTELGARKLLAEHARVPSISGWLLEQCWIAEVFYHRPTVWSGPATASYVFEYVPAHANLGHSAVLVPELD